jgi:hypothetical protein
MINQFKAPVCRIISLLVEGRYSDIEILTKSVRLAACDVKGIVNEYGRRLIMPPEEAFNLMNVVRVRNSGPQKWSITMPLWTEEEGRSDLSIILTLIQSDQGIEVELDDIHVL